MIEQNLPNDWKIIKLKELFDSSELNLLLELINENDFKKVREFLNARKEKLKKKGILPDYLYYYLLYKLGEK
jgi:hypothetical protein